MSFAFHRFPWRMILGLLISALCLYLAVRGVQWADVFSAWRSARPVWLVAGLGLLIAGWYVSALRWLMLLKPAPGVHARDTFSCIMIGYLANAVFPLRLGDVVRATLLGRTKGVGVTRAIGSMACERLFDLSVLIGLTLLLAFLVDIPPAIQRGVVSLAAIGSVLWIIFIVLAVQEERLHRLVDFFLRWVPSAVGDRVRALAMDFMKGVVVLRFPVRALGVFAFSVVQWGLAGAAVGCWLQAFNLSVPWYAAYFVLVVINLGAAIPSSPGYVGVYHYLAVLALSLWVPDRSAALAYAFGTHALNILANVTLGAYFLSRDGLSLRGLRKEAA